MVTDDGREPTVCSCAQGDLCWLHSTQRERTYAQQLAANIGSAVAVAMTAQDEGETEDLLLAIGIVCARVVRRQNTAYADGKWTQIVLASIRDIVATEIADLIGRGRDDEQAMREVIQLWRGLVDDAIGGGIIPGLELADARRDDAA